MTRVVVLSVLVCVVGLMSIWVATQGRRGPLLSPFATIMFVLVSVFGARPILMVARSDFDFYGFDVRDGVDSASLAGALAVVAMSVGYFAFERSVPRPDAIVDAADLDAALLARSSWVAIGMIGLWALAHVMIGGGVAFLSTMFEGRTAELRSRLAGVPVFVAALSTAASAVLAFGRVVTERRRRLLRYELLRYWMIGALTALPPLALGVRRFLLPTLIVLVVAAALPRWNERVKARSVAIAVLAFFVLASVPYVRSAGSRDEGADVATAVVDYLTEAGWSGALENYLLSYDTEMYSYTAFVSERLGSDDLPYGYGRWLAGDLLLAPLPAAILADLDMTTRSDAVLVDAFGATCAEGVCPVPSAVGVALTDFSAVGVAALFLVAGRAMRRFESAFASFRGRALIIGLLVLGFAPVLVRGNTVNLLWVAVNAAVLAMIGVAVVDRTGSRLYPLPGRTRQASSVS